MLSISNYLGIIVVWEIITLPLLVLFTFLMVVMTKPKSILMLLLVQRKRLTREKRLPVLKVDMSVLIV